MKRFTRTDYIARNACTHRQYYAQFVTPATKKIVLARFGICRLLRSKDEHLNDLPLISWDRIAPAVLLLSATKLKELGDAPLLSGGVCIAKEAAKQLIEEARSPCQLTLITE